MDGQGAAFGSVLADVLTGHVRRTEIVYHVKSVFMNKEDTVLILINLLIFITFLLIINNLSLGTKQIVLYQVRKKSGVFFFCFLKACCISLAIFLMDLLWAVSHKER